ncbi:MAG TPA: hypothetical protein VE954_01675 [Oligoflexus sp.]|nr:hypothetical protein [Oligoflexus sp.]
MNLGNKFAWTRRNVHLRPWSEAQGKLFLAGMVQALSLTFLWGHIADVWQLARNVSLTTEIPDDWQF